LKDIVLYSTSIVLYSTSIVLYHESFQNSCTFCDAADLLLPTMAF